MSCSFTTQVLAQLDLLRCENLGRSPPAVKHIRIVLATKTREGPHPHDKAECLIAATGHPFKTLGLPTALEELHQQCVQDCRRC